MVSHKFKFMMIIWGRIPQDCVRNFYIYAHGRTRVHRFMFTNIDLRTRAHTYWTSGDKLAVVDVEMHKEKSISIEMKRHRSPRKMGIDNTVARVQHNVILLLSVTDTFGSIFRKTFTTSGYDE